MLTITCTEGAPSRVHPQLPPDSVALIRDYLLAFDRLASAPGYSRGPQYAEFARDPQVGAVFRWKPKLSADEQDLLLYRLRPFVLQEEPFSFNNVANVLGKGIPDPVVRGFLKTERSRFSSEYWRQMWTISTDETALNSEAMFRKWLNSSEYHRDPDKRKEIEALISRSVPGLFEWVQTSMIFEKIEAISNVAALARVVLGLTESVTLGECVLRHADPTSA